MLKRILGAAASVVLVCGVLAGDVGVGSTREEVVARFGEPKSKMRAGAREILGYADGRVTLDEGRVTSVDLKRPPSPTAPVAATPPAVREPAPAIVKPKTSAPDIWRTDFVAAQAEAAASKRRLLVLFTGSDWCPPCMRFEADVAHAPDFLNLATTSFVLVKLDYPRSAPQSPALRARNEALREKYQVESYPSLLVISADGTKSSVVDTRKSRPADGLVDFYVQAVDEARRGKEKSSFWPF